MATSKSEQQIQSSQGQSSGTQGQSSGRGTQLQRGGDYGLGFPFSSSDFLRLDPFSMMRRMTQHFDRMLGDWPGQGSEGRIWSPAIEVKQDGENYTVRAELPGLKAEDVNLEMTDDAIILQGERKSEREETQGDVRICERRYGRFYRAIPLPEGAKTDQAKARFDNGVLEITVPAPETRPQRRQVQIESGGSSSSSPSSSGHKAA